MQAQTHTHTHKLIHGPLHTAALVAFPLGQLFQMNFHSSEKHLNNRWKVIYSCGHFTFLLAFYSSLYFTDYCLVSSVVKYTSF